MANSNYDATGVLRFAPGGKITPILTAIYGPMNLEALEDGGAYVAILGDDCGKPQHDDLLDALWDLGNKAGIPISGADGTETSPLQMILAYAQAHCTRVDIPRIQDLLEEMSADEHEHWTDYALFDLAQALDDGHGLISYEMEGAFTCSRPRLGEFGGDACFISRDLRAVVNTNGLLSLLREMDEHLSAGRDEWAAVRLLEWTRHLLGGASDEAKVRIAKELQKQLSNTSAFTSDADLEP